jgi:hypothetical protein
MKKLFLTFLILLFATNCFADIGWYICPYKRRDIHFDKTKPVSKGNSPTRYCAMDDYTNLIIYTDGGNWSETEVLGDRAIVKVKCSASTLTTINNGGVCRRIPLNALDNSLSTLTVAQRTAIRNELSNAGYTEQEIQARFPNNLRTYTLRDILKFLATRRLRPRYDTPTDTIVCDGIIQPVRAIESIDETIK